MVREFKKTGVAAAVAGALLASANVQAAVQLAEPGDVLLVPSVICDPAASAGQINTVVGLITFDKGRLGLRDGVGRDYSAPWDLATLRYIVQPAPTPGVARTPTRVTSPQAQNYNEAIHWYFYDGRSKHLLNGVIPATDNDFVRFNWCTEIEAAQAGPGLYGVHGYLIFTTDRVDQADFAAMVTPGVVPATALYGHSYQIQGNWASQAFVPILTNPIHEYNSVTTVNGFVVDASIAATNVTKREDYPAFTRVLSANDFTYLPRTSRPTAGRRDVFMRYWLDPALVTQNRMMFWFNFNAGAYTGSTLAALGYTRSYFPGYVPAPWEISSLTQSRVASGETFDSEQVYWNSFSVDIPNELNVFVSFPPGIATGPRFPGMIHADEEGYTVGSNPPFVVVNSGVQRFGIPEAVLVATNSTVTPAVNTTLAIPYISSGVAYNMLEIGAGGNASQLQTEMATLGPAY
jgi:hypothetical protein